MLRLIKAIPFLLLLILLLSQEVKGQSVETAIFEKDDMNNLSDLSYLKAILKNKKIVLLGESSHGIGEFYSLKSRIVKYLHQELGYEVIFMESGLGDVYFQYRGIDTVSAKSLRDRTVYGNFQCEEMMPLYEYLKFTNDCCSSPLYKPLKYAGFDSQNYTSSIELFEKIIDKYQPKKGKTLMTDILKYYEIPKYLWGNDRQPLFAYSDTIKKSAQEALGIIQQNRTSLYSDFGLDEMDVKVIERTLINYGKAVDLDWNIDNPMARRDSLMAENLFWMMENVYPNKKVIIWGHNLHIDKSGSNSDPTKWMGHYIAERFGKKAYHLGFFAREGESYEWWSKSNKSFKNDSLGNVEFLINPSQDGALFMDFTKLKKSNLPSWMFNYITGFEVENGGYISFIPSKRFDGIVVVGKAHVPTY